MGDAESTLVVASQRGDRPAFEQLVRRTARLLWSKLYLDTRDAHRAEDLAQETYLLAWRSIGTLDDPSRFRPWLMSIAQSVRVDAGRKDARKKRRLPTPATDSAGRSGGSPGSLDDLPAASNDPAADAEIADDRRRVLESLATLPEEYRQVLMLRYLAGADYAEISKQLALTNGSLRGLLHRGMAMLRRRVTGTRSKELL